VEGGANVCATYADEDYCAPSTIPIHRKITKCKGLEIKVKDCALVTETTDCQHSLDAIVECKGSGDPTGNSQ